jgi:hypothetical protein
MGLTRNFRPAAPGTRRRGVVALVLALLWIAGGDWNSTIHAAPNPFTACSLVSMEEAKLWDAAAKPDVMNSHSQFPNGQAMETCRYKVLAGEKVQKYLTVDVRQPVTKAQFEAGRQQNELAFNKVQKVAGLGDEAYAFGFYNFGVVTLLKGQNAVEIKVEYKSDNASVDPARIVAGIMPIARTAARRLP